MHIIARHHDLAPMGASRARRYCARWTGLAFLVSAVATGSVFVGGNVRAEGGASGVLDPSEGAYGPAIDDADPAASVPSQRALNEDPLAAAYMLMELSRRAEEAEAKQDHATAVRYFAAIGKAVPDRAMAFSKQCQYYQLMGELDAAIAACRRATGLVGAKLADHLRYAALLLGTVPPAAPVPDSIVSEVDATFQHLDSQGVTAPEVDVAWCKFALQMNDAGRLRRCVERLASKDPNGPVTLSHRFSLALLEGDMHQARRILEEAREIDMPPAALELMERELDARRGRVSFASLGDIALCVASLALAGSLFMAWWKRRRRLSLAA